MLINFTRKSIKFSVILIFFFISLFTLNANTFLENLNWAASGNILFFTADNGADSDPAPVLPSLGGSLAYQFRKNLRVEFTEDIYFTNYEYNTALGYPMACNPENRSAFVLGFITGIQLTGFIPLGKSGFVMRIYGGPSADFRFVFMAIGLKHPSDSADARMQTDAIRKYFWSNGRWFMPVIGVGADYPINSKLMLGLDIRAWFPLYKLSGKDNAPAKDNWRIGVGIRITPRKQSI
ncbi:MAG: hypothetical protein FWC22_06640 [Treponema sp.]|nr:hypothetical protein [Treponema sp.]